MQRPCINYLPSWKSSSALHVASYGITLRGALDWYGTRILITWQFHIKYMDTHRMLTMQRLVLQKPSPIMAQGISGVRLMHAVFKIVRLKC